MLTPEFLRRQAENCLRIARTCFDLASAERLRLMAAELNAKAAEMDEQERAGRRATRRSEIRPRNGDSAAPGHRGLRQSAGNRANLVELARRPPDVAAA